MLIKQDWLRPVSRTAQGGFFCLNVQNSGEFRQKVKKVKIGFELLSNKMRLKIVG
jgi:hypothetical protein